MTWITCLALREKEKTYVMIKKAWLISVQGAHQGDSEKVDSRKLEVDRISKNSFVGKCEV
jgi:hypothetical protein